MAFLENGTYVPKNAVKVTVWAKPDKDGDGEEVFQDQVDDSGNFLGRDVVTDNDGNVVKHYAPPEGFQNVPSRDAGADGTTDNHVRVNGRGVPVRNRVGHAVGIRPGTALLEYPDGTHELLRDDYSQKLFADSHEKVS